MQPNKDGKPVSKDVTNMLHALRGEHYRHEQNLQGSKVQLPICRSHNTPTLPFDQLYSHQRPQRWRPALYANVPTPVRLGPVGVLEYAYPRGSVPGPQPPPSWNGLFGKGKEKEEEGEEKSKKRVEALSLIFSHLSTVSDAHGEDPATSSVAPLALICLQYLLSLYADAEHSDEFVEEVVPYIPSHLRRELLHWSAQNSPLSNSKLFALCDAEGHVDGELIVVGPQASLPHDYFRKVKSTNTISACVGDTVEDDGLADDWDSSDVYTLPPFQTLVLLSTPLAVETLLTFPPTLTHLALLSLPVPAQIHRLPRICPLIEVLDLSFNLWLVQDPRQSDETILDRVEWERWSRLRVLGLRECGVGADIAPRVNRGRWTDVDIIGIDIQDAPSG